MRPFILLFIWGFISTSCIAQTGAAITVFGTAKEVVTGDVIPDLAVVAVDVADENNKVQGRSLGNGKYDLQLKEVATYRVTYSAPGYVSKTVEIAMEGPSEEDLMTGYGMQIDITLLQHFEDIDYSSLDQPFAKSAYDDATDTFIWDHGYTASLKESQSQLMKAYKNRMLTR